MFLVLQPDSYLKLKDYIDQMIPILSAACYTVRLMFHISNIITLKSIYFAYFHSNVVWNFFFFFLGGGEFFQQ